MGLNLAFKGLTDGSSCPPDINWLESGLVLNYKEKTTGPQTPQTVVDSWPKIAAITGKQATCIQSSPEIFLDLWCTIVGIFFYLP